MTPIRFLSALLLSTVLAACSTQPARAPAPAAGTAQAHDNLDATLWMQTAAEYDAAVLGAFANARQQLDRALADRCWDALPPADRQGDPCGLPPAIVTDADETLIDNSPFQARKIRDGQGFVYADWLAWVNERRATALPGAVEFLNHAAERGVTVYFVTNRDAPQEVESTVANLRALGFPVAADAGNVMLRGDARGPGREKGPRRQWIGQRHRVVLMLGDNLGDFVDGVKSDIATRDALVALHAPRWGVQWIMLPNPGYGSWEDAIQLTCPDAVRADATACKRSQLRFD